MTAPVIPNITSPVGVMLIDPSNGLPYRAGSADVATSSLPVANLTSPVGCTLINSTTGLPYH